MKFRGAFLAAVILWSISGPMTPPPGVYSFPQAASDAFPENSQMRFRTGGDGYPDDVSSPEAVLTPAQEYAAEVLAYLLRITLGMAGDPTYRHQWRVRGLDEPLNFNDIVATMTETERNPLNLMVLDPNILDLTTVLYHYDKGLSLYEGDYGVTSIYPASEFIAIRLLLLKKIHRKEKVNLAALMEREALLRNSAMRPTKQDLKAMNLTAGDVKLLQEIIQSKPHLLPYLKSPFLAAALYDSGAVMEDDFVKKKMDQARYREFVCRHLLGSKRPEAVKVCLLPSMTDEFIHEQSENPPLPDDFRPTRFLREMLHKLAVEIESAVKSCMEDELLSLGASHFALGKSEWESVWPDLAEKYLGFYAADQRPFVVYPENAAEAIRDICPQADVTLIILGRNVSKSIFFDPQKDSYPAVNRIYVDLGDIRHSQTEAEVRAIACFISKRIVERLISDETDGASGR